MVQERRIGVFVCYCGGNISDYVDVEKVREEIAREPGVAIARTHMFTCSDAAQQEMNGFFGRALLIVSMRPGALLAQIHLHILIRIQPGPLGHSPKGMHVEGGCAGRDHEPIQLGAPDVLDHLLLRSIGAGEHVGPGNSNPGLPGNFLPDLFHVYIVRNIASAIADKNADSPFLRHH